MEVFGVVDTKRVSALRDLPTIAGTIRGFSSTPVLRARAGRLAEGDRRAPEG